MARRNHAIDRHLGARVRSARIENQISQTVLGEHLGISFQQVQKYELGKDRISASQLVGIARTLGKDMSFFFENIDEGEVAHDNPALGMGKVRRSATANDIKIIRMLHAIEDERVKTKLFGLMEAIVGAQALIEPNDATPDETGFRNEFRQ